MESLATPCVLIAPRRRHVRRRLEAVVPLSLLARGSLSEGSSGVIFGIQNGGVEHMSGMRKILLIALYRDAAPHHEPNEKGNCRSDAAIPTAPLHSVARGLCNVSVHLLAQSYTMRGFLFQQVFGERMLRQPIACQSKLDCLSEFDRPARQLHLRTMHAPSCAGSSQRESPQRSRGLRAAWLTFFRLPRCASAGVCHPLLVWRRKSSDVTVWNSNRPRVCDNRCVKSQIQTRAATQPIAVGAPSHRSPLR